MTRRASVAEPSQGHQGVTGGSHAWWGAFHGTAPQHQTPRFRITRDSPTLYTPFDEGGRVSALRVKGCLGAAAMSAFDGEEAGVDPSFGALFDGDDGFVLLGDADGNAGPGGSEGLTAEDPPDEPDPLALNGQDTSAELPQKKKRVKVFPEAGSRLLYIMLDVEFSHPIKFIGEIFQIAAAGFLIEEVGSAPGYRDSQLTPLEPVTTFTAWVQPSLQFGQREFSYAVINVSTAPLLGWMKGWMTVSA